jgi:hypothetical protein
VPQSIKHRHAIETVRSVIKLSNKLGNSVKKQAKESAEALERFENPAARSLRVAASPALAPSQPTGRPPLHVQCTPPTTQSSLLHSAVERSRGRAFLPLITVGRLKIRVGEKVVATTYVSTRLDGCGGASARNVFPT